MYLSLSALDGGVSLDGKLVAGQRAELLAPYTHRSTQKVEATIILAKRHTKSAAKKAQLHQVKGKSLAEPFGEEGKERRMRRKIKRFFNF